MRKGGLRSFVVAEKLNVAWIYNKIENKYLNSEKKIS